MSKVLEELARVIGRAWAKEWVKNFDERRHASHPRPAVKIDKEQVDTQARPDDCQEDRFRGSN